MQLKVIVKGQTGCIPTVFTDAEKFGDESLWVFFLFLFFNLTNE